MVEVAIVQATAAGELPHSLDGVEFGTVSGQEVQGKVRGVLFPPRSVQAGVVITGIVGDDHHPSPGSAAGGAELLEELKEAGPIEFAGFQTEPQAPIPQAHGSEIPHTLAGSASHAAESALRRSPKDRRLRPASRLGVFFMGFLCRGISMGQSGAWFA